MDEAELESYRELLSHMDVEQLEAEERRVDLALRRWKRYDFGGRMVESCRAALSLLLGELEKRNGA